MRMVRQDPGQQTTETDPHGTGRAPEVNRAEADEQDAETHGAETAKDVNVVRGDDRPQAVRHSE